MNKNSISKMTWLIIISFLLVPICVSVISTIHVINFFSLSNGFGLALTLAIAFEIGALSALAGLVALGKINKNVVWFIFILLTIFQVNGNTYYAYDVLTQKMVIEPNLIKNWAELFGLADEDPIFIKRIIALISGGILPIVSLAFLDLLVDYIRKTFGIEENKLPENIDLKKNTEVNLEDTPSSQIVVESKEEKSVIEEENIDLDEKLDSIISDGKVETHEEENFQKILDEKKKRLDDMRQPNMDMFINKLEKNRYSQKEINLFLTLCNYLEIFKVSYTQKIALKSYDEAKEILSNYLTLGE